MSYSNQFYSALGIEKVDNETLKSFSKRTGVSINRLKYYNNNNICPSGNDLERILNTIKISEVELLLRMGRLNKDIIEAIRANAPEIANLIANHKSTRESQPTECDLVFETNLGKLYQADCYSFLRIIDSDSIDLIFADPPFNLNKLYPSNIDDNIKTEKYLNWCQEWLRECIRVLKHGGALFIWNLPKWNASLTNFLDGQATFRNWIGVDIKYSLPIQGRLYPSHYSLLYYIKGEKPNVFHPDRLPMQVCKKCFGDIKDYGGYKDKMNPKGINISDIWIDIPPVRHAKYKRREGSNELSLKLLDRIIEMSSNENDIILDPFGGSGTTYMAAELKGRRWIGCEIGPPDVILERFEKIEDERKILSEYRSQVNALFPEKIRQKREEIGLWTSESLKTKNS